ncbi:pimeloyl-ACP methyl ester carboxylesterase [Marmoricola sp. OAE513]|uniref:alpha/beta fold hydrolase n=1 Tax=Marmoricola sp. OAE513 TaxID=2817894 RepID=UPI001AE649E6
MSTTTTATRFAVSADGTRIAYDLTGTGPVLVIVEGALCHRGMGAAKTLTPALRDHFTVVGYDRRGRGESSDTQPYAVQREVEDLVAVLDAVGPDAFVFAASSGAALALEAARQGVPMRRLAVYEAPFIVDDTHAPNAPDLPEQIERLVAADDRGGAVKLFMRTVGVPAPMLALMPLFPVWKGLKAVAHTLVHDFRIVLPFEQGEPLPVGHYGSVAAETIVIAGGKSPAYLQNAQAAIADQLPHGRLLTLKGQTHMIKAKVTGPELVRFFV